MHKTLGILPKGTSFSAIFPEGDKLFGVGRLVLVGNICQSICAHRQRTRVSTRVVDPGTIAVQWSVVPDAANFSKTPPLNTQR